MLAFRRESAIFTPWTLRKKDSELRYVGRRPKMAASKLPALGLDRGHWHGWFFHYIALVG
jgi:hypothetical protein